MDQTDAAEIAGLAESLTAHQRQVLARLLGEAVAGVAGLERHPAQERAHRLQDAIQPVRDLLDALQGSLEPADEDSRIRPFTVRFPAPGVALLRLSPRILSWPRIWENRAHDWIPTNLAEMLVDVSALPELNSSTIAWLVTLAQRLPGGRLSMQGLAPHLRRAIAVLRLEQVLVSID
jgi:hypothetical protein